MQSPEFAQACADSFPAIDTVIEVIEVVKYDTTYQPGDTLVYVDTLNINHYDTIRLLCPPQKVITKTITEVKHVVRVDNAKVTKLENQLKDAKGEVEKWSGKAKRRGKAFFFSLLGIALLLVGLGYLLKTKIIKP